MANSSAPEPRLRIATVADAEMLSRLGARLFEQTFGAVNTAEDMATYLGQSFRPDLQAAELGDQECRVWIAEDVDGTPIGYAMLWRGRRTEGLDAKAPAEIQRIYADRAFHGRAVGDTLMRACVEQARVWGCDVIWLAVWQRNPRAIAFYEKNGFQRVGVKTFQLGADTQHDYVMVKNIHS
jgi:ribosomal protein S18 acetylase RimI-like enzyme